MNMNETLPLPLTLSEADLQRTVVDFALLRGWRVCHSRPARTMHGWATPITGHPGWPDLALARDGVFLAAELKRSNGRLTPDQRLWLAALGEHGRVWTPKDWTEIVDQLS